MCDMPGAPKIRLTAATIRVLDAIMRGSASDPLWGYRICETAGLGSGTVYPILERLENAGLIEGQWEAGVPADRPRRRFYAVTGAGRAWYAAAAAPGSRVARWLAMPNGELA